MSWRIFSRFLLSPSAALNLAVIRAMVFGALLAWLLTEVGGEASSLLLTISIGATALAVVGCFTRVAAWTSVLSAVYYLSATYAVGPNLVLSPILTVGLLLACSWSGDALSIDSLWKSLQQADRGLIHRTPRSIRYGMPIRLAMLVLVVGYFVAALQPILQSGGEAFSGKLQLDRILQEWPGMESKEAASPEAGNRKLLAVCTNGLLLMGLVGPIVVFWRQARIAWAAITASLIFLYSQLMGVINYTHLALFALFVDWQRLFAWVGRRIFHTPLVVLYDGNCKMCRRTMSLLLSLDWLHSLKPVSAFQRDRFTAMGLGHLEDAALMKDMHAGELGTNGEWRVETGYQAYQRIAWRVPLLWFTLPLVYLPPVVLVGNRIYRQVADSRACSIPTARDSAPVRLFRWSPALIIGVAVVIICAQLLVALGVIGGEVPPVADDAIAISRMTTSP